MKPVALDRKFLAECFEYDPATGSLRWKNRPRSHFRTELGQKSFNLQFAGEEAGWKVFRRGGEPLHIRVSINGKNFTVHRIALVLSGVALGDLDGDHRNGKPFDNRLRNLRSANKNGSAMNRGDFKKETKLPKGVSQCRGKFMAKIGRAGKHYLGMFPTAKLASQAYRTAAATRFGEFARA